MRSAAVVTLAAAAVVIRYTRALIVCACGRATSRAMIVVCSDGGGGGEGGVFGTAHSSWFQVPGGVVSGRTRKTHCAGCRNGWVVVVAGAGGGGGGGPHAHTYDTRHRRRRVTRRPPQTAHSYTRPAAGSFIVTRGACSIYFYYKFRFFILSRSPNCRVQVCNRPQTQPRFIKQTEKKSPIRPCYKLFVSAVCYCYLRGDARA